ncbi:serine hydrolase domain-containing protein [Phyllobacterium myrsinacearum]|uniref:CubicO group peptidase (Beta-lactamase class C family) n=1 Tax=Phyllobacterium myrsinacearum TaxID=28101 RepID=A0A839EKU5_9HYPH|nr:serine hydrolase [Phyllobacterium myrsinacearum]MBA8881073.1 CubicO group peptidase (beta-lactamase class C family) [Phyllobacterium myrsinacearum]
MTTSNGLVLNLDEDVETRGWSRHGLEAMRAYAATIASDALIVLQGDRLIANYGDLECRYQCHSMRKSFLSALIGIAVEKGTIDLSLTLQQLDIDDKESLSSVEKQATIFDLLTARSGIYHPAGYETAWMRSLKPPRHSHAPGTHWCYSNWDFNALGTIYTQLTGFDIHDAFNNLIAKPLGMEDFRYDEERRDGGLQPDECSWHPAYPFRMSARDLARFGQLFLQQGEWNGRQIIPRDWVTTSVLPYSDAGTRGAYGYMWWICRSGIAFPEVVLPDDSYHALGAGGHFCLIIPAFDLVIIHRVNTDIADREVDRFQFGKLLKLLLAARRN